MRKLAITVALASTALATPALARDGSWYVGLESGAMLVEDIDFDVNRPNTTVDSQYSVDPTTGVDTAYLMGYDFGGFRVEGEVGYKFARVDTITDSLDAARSPRGGQGKVDSLSFMVNAMVDIGDDDGIQGFVGGGAGVARVKFKNVAGKTRAIALDDSDSRFAWQAIAGVRLPINESWDFAVKYRFFNVDNLKLYSAAPVGIADGRLRTHSILGQITYNFGGPSQDGAGAGTGSGDGGSAAGAGAGAGSQVPLAPAEPPPAVTPGPFIVFFDWNKSDITAEAASILDNAAAAYQSTGTASIVLAGHADKSGTDRYNLALSQRRANAVKAYLAGKGVPETAMATEAFGESRPLVETADGVREPQNRRVEITFGTGAGM